MITFPASMIKGASIFLLTSIPICELPEDLQEIANRVRSGNLPKNSALDYLVQTKHKFVREWIQKNYELDQLIG
jgi:hypothetical protein